MLGKIIGGVIGSIFGPAGAVAGAVIGHQFDKDNTNSTTTRSSVSLFNEKLLRGPYYVKGDTFALSLYFPVSVDRELHNTDIFSSAISDMKFHYKNGGIPLFADSIIWFIQKTEIQSEIDCIVTCPTSTIRAKQPLELIASKVSELTSIPYYKVLMKDNQPAKQMGYEGRKESARSIRLSDSNSIKGKRVLLIDDIITSGSTMRVSTERLLEGGAIEVLTLAVLSTADAFVPDKLELHPKSMSTNKTLSQRIKDSAVTLYYIYEDGKGHYVYYPEYEVYRKKQAQINEEYRKQQEQMRREEVQRKKEEAKKEADKRLEFENQIRGQLSNALITGDRNEFVHLLKHGVRLNDHQVLELALHIQRFEMVKLYIDRFPSELHKHEVLFACLESDMQIDTVKFCTEAWHSKVRRDAIIKAVNEGRINVVMKMKDLNFNFSVKDNMGYSLVEIARKMGHINLANYLRNNIR
ncbi:hypothetical protein J41TS12_06060 [Paenibacillus antibioticophila]|uniref:Phosphoribosyltransferase domain-containing protein n=1 Tax=Paenibacillus antibioticophila TaxID=1274374 RepID=A0A919XRU4_9BACL|nr:phosphoribosyltransferase family protein [Paenibacillus antibioticophila]GIO35745.1 hypothetical protein J41TS12_06060 [Paenibacillus antibioticophila]